MTRGLVSASDHSRADQRALPETAVKPLLSESTPLAGGLGSINRSALKRAGPSESHESVFLAR